eukprot:TRINITY_DN26232_c0_g1_i1.p1 TRINITY_DN26232_c0_g1~~TRINITY_DN26232_c0_g1_i1.p1  ORF type:complete len:353 (-),score=55.78 TRINITY_DN26232_c0_g1_i1:200-1258(-)
MIVAQFLPVSPTAQPVYAVQCMQPVAPMNFQSIIMAPVGPKLAVAENTEMSPQQFLLTPFVLENRDGASPGPLKQCWMMPEVESTESTPSEAATPTTAAVPSPTAAVADGPWQCDLCETTNKANQLYCMRRNCGAPRERTWLPSAKNPGPGWLCNKCGNHNYEGREVCNNKACAAPGPWVCVRCKNRNYAHRMTCNGRNCDLARPLLSMRRAKSKNTNAQYAGSSHFLPGSWVCLGCGNVNFPQRKSCNAKHCGMLRCKADGGPPRSDMSHRTVILSGAWICTACENVNWHMRDHCNRHSCRRPRADVDGGPPKPGHIQAKEGSWVCSDCGNLNGQQHQACSRHDCGKQRHD